jgi:hypothetical protein
MDDTPDTATATPSASVPEPSTVPATHQENEAPMQLPIDTSEQLTSPEYEAQVTALDETVQAATETASGYLPAPLELVMSFAAGALTMLLALLGAQKMMREKRRKDGSSCKRCRGSGVEANDGMPALQG